MLLIVDYWLTDVLGSWREVWQPARPGRPKETWRDPSLGLFVLVFDFNLRGGASSARDDPLWLVASGSG